MANRSQQLELPPPRTCTRTEFTAPRAKGLPIACLNFDSDERAYSNASAYGHTGA
ncbi:hypothetical protein [Burkholderia alba]|uniref:hypothetical protein n=1 Tax=Burkholderia alba TaxID=2683677 RepID=UPI002B05DAB7|nr:hypothetical protein [Burkholderia alba]